MNARKGFDAKELWLLERDLDRDQAGGRPKPEADMTTNERLRALGFWTTDAGNYRKHVYDADAALRFTGTALECPRWLDEIEALEG